MSFSKFFEKMRAQFDEYRFRMLLRSHFLQSREERQARVRAIIELSAELHRIRQTKIFATRLGESAIEAVIEGDWKRAEEFIPELSFDDEDEDTKARYGPLWEPFTATLRAVCAEAKLREAGADSPDN